MSLLELDRRYMGPLYIATETFDPSWGTRWSNYIIWSGLTHLTEVVSLDSMLCPPILKEIEDDYWPHIVNEDSMVNYFIDFGFLRERVVHVQQKNVLCVFRNPESAPSLPPGHEAFTFLGYDLVDVEGSASALTNCGGFPDVFSNNELSNVGLLTSLSRAKEVQGLLCSRYPEEHHADCHLWAVFRHSHLSSK